MKYRTLTKETWEDLERLFGPKGACGGCWCMWWRVERGGKTWNDLVGESARHALRRLVSRGAAHGMIAYDGEEPVGWCTYGPRSHFPRLARVRAYRELDQPEGLWSVPCFFIRRDRRGRGLAHGLLDAALKEMEKAGAHRVEAYPVTATKAGARLPAVFAYTGPVELFSRAGFKVVHAANPLKPVMRKGLRKRRVGALPKRMKRGKIAMR